MFRELKDDHLMRVKPEFKPIIDPKKKPLVTYLDGGDPLENSSYLA
jgi:hypothetical protein